MWEGKKETTLLAVVVTFHLGNTVAPSQGLRGTHQVLHTFCKKQAKITLNLNTVKVFEWVTNAKGNLLEMFVNKCSLEQAFHFFLN